MPPIHRLRSAPHFPDADGRFVANPLFSIAAQIEMHSWLTAKSLLRCRWATTLGAAAVAAGCASPLSTSYLAGSRREEAAGQSTGMQAASAEEILETEAVVSDAAPPTAEQALASVLDELQEIEAIDRQAKDRLLAQLKSARPADYPLIVEAFRTALAYREQIARREAQDGVDEAIAAATQRAQDAQFPAESSRPATRVAAELRTPLESPDRPADLADSATRRADEAPARRPASRIAEPNQTTTASRGSDLRETSALQAADRVAALPSPPLQPRDESAEGNLHQVAYEHGDAQPNDWRTSLNASIGALNESIAPQPRNVDELHDHMRLRILQLIAGDEQQAYRPIPGASPDQQDYLSQQLFAIATFLNDEQHADEKDRAAATLLHLDEARGRLADLAALRIRNAEFVESVDGYGAYETAAEAKFRPGQSVTVYAEIENFRSQSTAEGYRTTLATSYQIVDATGRRVEGAQFPEVEDVCRSRRRDFHMQYGIELPTRIYPDAYELQLIITDRQSNKIGHASIPFDIVE